MRKKFIALLLSASMMAASFVACGSKGPNDSEVPASAPQAEETATESDVAYIQGKGTLLVGITDFAPMDYKDDGGEWIGFDADLAKKVAENLGVEVEFVEIDWDNKILELQNKSIDVVWNGMTLTPEVTSSMECTKAYLNNAQVVVVPADKADSIKTAEDAAALSFAVESGSAGEAAAEENGFDYVAVKSQADAVMEVAAGTSQACIIDLLMAGAMIGEGTSYPNLAHTVELTTEEYGIGCRKGSDLAKYINEQLKALYDDGTMADIATEYGVQEAVVAQ
ncbi:transporter substrate-binding domain-containing protein [Pseudobutyrivibrio xylanivorans]|uniref:Polar amino acid transport system substrate-binding protein n=1 Tax=Pseudobutyrivibrio xylanivorans TaxID=185007 RepID=A0A1G5RSP6_PSEXY|nr:transporter substrate-binding domain-containing protein [Pseudobutyrivibrio xylanivorans]SCZ77037.1 polar amino acid transport system substrate-binding protein [Pseudobutyrivibrio xylanivorans]